MIVLNKESGECASITRRRDEKVLPLCSDSLEGDNVRRIGESTQGMGVNTYDYRNLVRL